MERNYLEDFPVNDAQHVVENGKSNYSNMFFHEIDLKYILERLDALSNIATVDDLRLSADGLSVVLSANNEVIDTVNLSTPIESKINEASTALMQELNLVKGRVTVLEASMGAAESDIDDLQANINGFRYFPAGTDIVGLLDDSPYKDANGLYVLADSTTGATLLADTSTYKRIDSTEDLHGKVGADTCSPFNKGGESGGGGDVSSFTLFDTNNKTVININNDTRLSYSIVYGDGWSQQDKFTYDGVNMWSPTTVPSYVDRTVRNEIALHNNSDNNIYVKLAYKTNTSNNKNFIELYLNGDYSNRVRHYGVSEGESDVFCIPANHTWYLSYVSGDTPGPNDNAGIILYEIGGN